MRNRANIVVVAAASAVALGGNIAVAEASVGPVAIFDAGRILAAVNIVEATVLPVQVATLTDSHIFDIRSVVLDVAVASDGAAFAVSIGMADSAVTSDIAAKTAGIPAFDAIAITGAAILFTGVNPGDALSTTDVLSFDIGATYIADPVVTFDAVITTSEFIRGLADAASTVESTIVEVGLPVSESVSLAESTTYDANAAIIDSVSGTEDTTLSISSLQTDAVLASEGLAFAGEFFRTFTGSAAVSEVVLFSVVPAFSEVLVSSDAAVVSSTAASADSATMTDTMVLDVGACYVALAVTAADASVFTIQRAPSDGASASDLMSTVLTTLRSFGDSAIISEAASLGLQVPVSDSATATGVSVLSISLVLADNITAYDADNAAFVFSAEVGVGVVNGDGALNQVVLNSGSRTSGTGGDFTAVIYHEALMNGGFINSMTLNGS